MQHGLPSQVYKAPIHPQLPIYQQFVGGGNIGAETDQG